jgi:putative ABC transport system permease protein
MQFKEAMKLALQSLWANKMRTILTLFGVVIGVASVIAVVTLVNGANRYVATKVYGKGADVFTVSKQPAVITSYEEYVKYQKRKNLNMDDFAAVRDRCKRCQSVGALLNTSGKVVSGTQSSTDTDIRGWSSEMPVMYNLNITEGRGFTPADDDRAERVAIIGSDILDDVMGPGDPVGKEIRVDGEVYTVIGVGEKQGKTLGQSQDNWVAVPIESFIHTYGAANKSVTIYAKAGSAGAGLDAAVDEVRAIVRVERHDPPGGEDTFEISTNDTFVGLWKSISQSFSAVVVGIAAISLVVGGIVIMNIMLVSVTERTREIGIRKALGARRGDVLLQFLIESGLMSLLGGIVGVIGGAVVAKLITLAVGFPSSIQLWSVIVGLITALGVGIFFGVYPARKAAMLDPITALRAEM